MPHPFSASTPAGPGARRPGVRRLRLLLGRRLAAALFLIACVLQLWTSCNKREAPAGDPKVQAGRVLYLSHCTACHSADPARDGSLGPAVKHASLDLVQARVLRGEYPPGYTPKRSTKIMQRLPMTEEEVEKVHAFLNAP